MMFYNLIKITNGDFILFKDLLFVVFTPFRVIVVFFVYYVFFVI
ncbi:hypothetical protein MYRA21_3343 [Myroides sp. A21]|nr:hypothetical protein MYRA21_3343 [Myroides sp. A21]